MNNFIFENKTKVYFGKGGVKEYLGCLLKQYGPTVMLQVLSGEGHMYSGQAVRQTIDSISDFFYTHLEKAVMPQS